MVTERVKSLRRKVKVRKLAKELKEEAKYRVLFRKKITERWLDHEAYDEWLEIREYAPIKRTIQFRSLGKTSKYHVQLPYQIFVFRITDFYENCGKYYEWIEDWPAAWLAFAKSPIKNKQSSVYFPSLPNMDRNFAVCLGGVGVGVDNGNDEIGPDTIVEHYWNSTFTTSLGSGLVTLKGYFGTFEKWEKLSLEQVNRNLTRPCKFGSFLTQGGIKNKVSIRKR